jgi:glucose-1-phosphate cytidylyltransferase
MKVVVLCGGQGTRLREETEYRPKPMVDIGGRPILWHILKTYAHYGFNEFVLTLGYRGNMIKDYFLSYEAMNNDFTINLGHKSSIRYHGLHEEQDFQVTLVDTGLETLTGGRVRRIQRYIPDDTFMVTYGDGLADVDICKLIDFHHSHGKLATVTAVQPFSRFGVLKVDSNGQVNSFDEKPQSDAWISAGYFVFHRRIFDFLDADQTILEREPMEKLASEGQLMYYRHTGFFYAMDTYREYKALNDMWTAGEAPWRVWKR